MIFDGAGRAGVGVGVAEGNWEEFDSTTGKQLRAD